MKKFITTYTNHLTMSRIQLIVASVLYSFLILGIICSCVTFFHVRAGEDENESTLLQYYAGFTLTVILFIISTAASLLGVYMKYKTAPFCMLYIMGYIALMYLFIISGFYIAFVYTKQTHPESQFYGVRRDEIVGRYVIGPIIKFILIITALLANLGNLLHLTTYLPQIYRN